MQWQRAGATEGHRLLLVDGAGCRTSNFGMRTAAEQVPVTQAIRDMPCRDDDVFLLAPMKSGTHWVWEIAGMLLNNEAKIIPKPKESNMLEFVGAPVIQEVTSPRLLNSHLPLDLLPVKMFEKRCKIIHMLRNPKDMIVSWYHHCLGIKTYDFAAGTWDDFFQTFMTDDLEYGSWFKYIKQWQTFIQENPGHPVHVINYEDLHKNNLSEIRRLADFLGVNADDKLMRAISQSCHIKNMHKEKAVPKKIQETAFNGDFSQYRKGIVGDWENVFTVAQNDILDQRIEQELGGFNFRFTYN